MPANNDHALNNNNNNNEFDAESVVASENGGGPPPFPWKTAPSAEVPMIKSTMNKCRALLSSIDRLMRSKSLHSVELHNPANPATTVKLLDDLPAVVDRMRRELQEITDLVRPHSPVLDSWDAANVTTRVGRWRVKHPEKVLLAGFSWFGNTTQLGGAVCRGSDHNDRKANEYVYVPSENHVNKRTFSIGAKYDTARPTDVKIPRIYNGPHYPPELAQLDGAVLEVLHLLHDFTIERTRLLHLSVLSSMVEIVQWIDDEEVSSRERPADQKEFESVMKGDGAQFGKARNVVHDKVMEMESAEDPEATKLSNPAFKNAVIQEMLKKKKTEMVCSTPFRFVTENGKTVVRIETSTNVTSKMTQYEKITEDQLRAAWQPVINARLTELLEKKFFEDYRTNKNAQRGKPEDHNLRDLDKFAYNFIEHCVRGKYMPQCPNKNTRSYVQLLDSKGKEARLVIPRSGKEELLNPEEYYVASSHLGRAGNFVLIYADHSDANSNHYYNTGAAQIVLPSRYYNWASATEARERAPALIMPLDDILGMMRQFRGMGARPQMSAAAAVALATRQSDYSLEDDNELGDNNNNNNNALCGATEVGMLALPCETTDPSECPMALENGSASASGSGGNRNYDDANLDGESQGDSKRPKY